MSRIELPLPVFFAWIVLTLVLMGQGLRLADRHQESFEPSRPPVLDPEVTTEISEGEALLLFPGEAGERLAIYQDLPERRLLRWTEDDPPLPGPLAIPLAGLGPGEYLVCRVVERLPVAPREMDRPVETLDVRARFRILPR